jgi:hypothetical protein
MSRLKLLPVCEVEELAVRDVLTSCGHSLPRLGTAIIADAVRRDGQGSRFDDTDTGRSDNEVKQGGVERMVILAARRHELKRSRRPALPVSASLQG